MEVVHSIFTASRTHCRSSGFSSDESYNKVKVSWPRERSRKNVSGCSKREFCRRHILVLSIFLFFFYLGSIVSFSLLLSYLLNVFLTLYLWIKHYNGLALISSELACSSRSLLISPIKLDVIFIIFAIKRKKRIQLSATVSVLTHRNITLSASLPITAVRYSVQNT